MKQTFFTLLSLLSITTFAQKKYQDTDTLHSKNITEVTVYGSMLRTTKISKNGLVEMELPQAISVIDKKILKEQQVASLTDILKNVNGIYIMGNTGGYQEEIASRGSSISSTNTFKNGIRFFNGMKIEISGAETVEILKGNTAMEYGNVAPGGVLNIITKKPLFDFGGNAAITIGSFNNIKPQIDVYGALNSNKTIAYRFNTSYQKTNSFRNYVKSDLFYVNPSLLFKLSKKSTLLIEGDFSKSNTVPDFGAGIVNYQIVDLPRSRFTGVSWGNYKAEQSFVLARYNTQLSKQWELNAMVGYRNYNTDLFANNRPNASSGTVAANGTWKRSLQRSAIKDNYTIQQVDATSKFNTGMLKHKILVGIDAEQFTTSTTAYNTFSNYDQINIFEEYNPAKEPAIPTLTEATLTKNTVSRFGAYVQDLISLPKYVKFFIGARYNYIDTKADVYTYTTKSNAVTYNLDQPISPKVGIIFQPKTNHTFFASYSNSFSLNTGVDINGNALTPSIIDQYEVGIKNRLCKGKMQLNITAYRIVNSNLAQTSLANGNTNSNIKELAGETVSKGVELDVICRSIKNLNVMLGYSFNETKYTESNIYIIGSELRYNPKNTANASVSYTFCKGKLKNLNLGLLSQYFGDRFAGRSTRLTVVNDAYKLVPINAYTVVDCMVGYSYKKISINGKLSNIFNEMSYNVHDDNSVNPIAPTNYSLQLTYKF